MIWKDRQFEVEVSYDLIVFFKDYFVYFFDDILKGLRGYLSNLNKG